MAVGRKSAFVGNARLNAGGLSRSRKIEEGTWNQLVPKKVTLAAAFDEYRMYRWKMPDALQARNFSIFALFSTVRKGAKAHAKTTYLTQKRMRSSFCTLRGSSTSTGSAIRSVAVLPLDNYSRDDKQEYFVEGMNDELTATLANISQLRVISRGSAMQFKGAQRPAIPVIGRTLNVDAVVEGSVLRSGDKVRITIQLIDAHEDRHLWAKSFERTSDDVLALQVRRSPMRFMCN
jgi:TolB-like protein